MGRLSQPRTPWPAGRSRSPYVSPYALGQVPVAAAPPGAAPMAAQEWREYFIYTFDFSGSRQLSAGTANALPNAALPFQSISIRTESDAPWEWVSSIYVATDPRVYVQFKDDRAGRFTHKDTLDLRTIAGLGNQLTVGTNAPGFFPSYKSEPWMVSPASLFSCVAKDFSGAANTVRLSLHGQMVRAGAPPWQVNPWTQRPRRIVETIPFEYPLPDDNTNYNVAANGSITFSVQTDSDSDFLCEELVGIRQGAATVLLVDGVDRQRAWMDRAVHIDNLVGNGVQPNVLPAPRWIGARAVVQGTFTDLSGATNQMRLYLRGRKVYYDEA